MSLSAILLRRSSSTTAALLPSARLVSSSIVRSRTARPLAVASVRLVSATQHRRGYATQNPKEPKGKKDPSGKDKKHVENASGKKGADPDRPASASPASSGQGREEKPKATPEETKIPSNDEKQPAAAPSTRGFQNDPDAKNSATEESTSIPPSHKLSPEDAKLLDEALELNAKHSPVTHRKAIERVLLDYKKNGIEPDTLELLRSSIDAMHGKSTIANFAKFVRLMNRILLKEQNILSKDEKEGFRFDANQKPDEQKSGEQEDQSSKQSNKGEAPKLKTTEVKFDLSTMITAALTAYLLYRVVVPSENKREITWQEFKTSFLDKGLVEKLEVVNAQVVKVTVLRDAVKTMYPDSPAVHPNFFYTFTIGSVEAFERRLDEAQNELQIPQSQRIPVSYTNAVSWSSMLLSLSPVLLIVGSTFWLMRRSAGGGGSGPNSIFGMGRSRAKKYNHETDIQIRFKDVAGMDEAKQEITEFVSFLKEPGQFQRLGAKIPRGAILSGPPGTGKTLLAKATAGESQVPFFSVSGSEFVEMFVGVGASRVRDLFANARKSTPCIIFIDEIDAIGKSRAKQNYGAGNDEREATLNQILTEMDGFNTSEQVVVLAGTNRPDVLDAALMRPGRFDRHITIDPPTMEGRKQIFAVHLRKILTDVDMDYLTGRLSALTPGFSGADIANACNEAALIAARAKADKVEMVHFEQAIERVVGGLEKKSLVLSPDDKRTVAYHEAGHAICGWFFKDADPLLKVSIIPRGQGALGYAQYLPPGDRYLINEAQLLDQMAMILGGRVSEELHFDNVTSGASDDFKKVTRMATLMVTRYGMSERLGMLYFDEDQAYGYQKPFSEATAQTIDTEVRRLVDAAYKQCKTLLAEKKAEVGKVAEELLKLEMLTRDDLVRLLGPRPGGDNKDFEKYFGGKVSSEEQKNDKSPPSAIPPPVEDTPDTPPSPALMHGPPQL